MAKKVPYTHRKACPECGKEFVGESDVDLSTAKRLAGRKANKHARWDVNGRPGKEPT